MASSKTFFDTNILLDIVLERDKATAATKAVRQAASGEFFISALTVHLLVHFGRKKVALSVLEDLLFTFNIESLTADDIRWAFDNARDKDFEDALQLAVAIRTGCDTFITFDQKPAKRYSNLPTLKVHLLK